MGIRLDGRVGGRICLKGAGLDVRRWLACLLACLLAEVDVHLGGFVGYSGENELLADEAEEDGCRLRNNALDTDLVTSAHVAQCQPHRTQQMPGLSIDLLTIRKYELQFIRRILPYRALLAEDATFPFLQVQRVVDPHWLGVEAERMVSTPLLPV